MLGYIIVVVGTASAFAWIMLTCEQLLERKRVAGNAEVEKRKSIRQSVAVGDGNRETDFSGDGAGDGAGDGGGDDGNVGADAEGDGSIDPPEIFTVDLDALSSGLLTSELAADTVAESAKKEEVIVGEEVVTDVWHARRKSRGPHEYNNTKAAGEGKGNGYSRESGGEGGASNSSTRGEGGASNSSTQRNQSKGDTSKSFNSANDQQANHHNSV
jgi:hypothetical protein